MGRCVAWDVGSLLGASPRMPHTPLHCKRPCACWTLPALGPAPARTQAHAQAPGGNAPGGQEEAVPHAAAASSPFPVSLVVGSQACRGRSPQGAHGWTWVPHSQRQPPGPQAPVGAGAAELRTWLPPRPRPSAQESLGAQLGERCCFQGPRVASSATVQLCRPPRPAPQCSVLPSPSPPARPLASPSRSPGAGALCCRTWSKRIPLDGTVAPRIPQSRGAWPLPPPFVDQKRPREAPEAFQADPAPLPVLGCWGARVSAFGVLVARRKGPGKATRAILASGIPLHISLGVRVRPRPSPPSPSQRGPCPLCPLAHGYPQGSSSPTHRPDLVPALRTRGTWVPGWPWTPRSGLALFSWHPGLSSALLRPPGSGSRAQARGPLPESGDFRR